MAHRDPRKAERRAFAVLQDRIEGMSEDDCLAAIACLVLPSAPLLHTAIVRALRAQIATLRENKRCGWGGENPHPDDVDDDDDMD